MHWKAENCSNMYLSTELFHRIWRTWKPESICLKQPSSASALISKLATDPFSFVFGLVFICLFIKSCEITKDQYQVLFGHSKIYRQVCSMAAEPSVTFFSNPTILTTNHNVFETVASFTAKIGFFYIETGPVLWIGMEVTVTWVSPVSQRKAIFTHLGD